ncbi:MAG TPA: hypothetical protein VHS07_01445 [Candidatus Binataceae bacterium]|jgi:hypothetical protein|nr:hypothetical protein [Candidatus Binataceae bacterium]
MAKRATSLEAAELDDAIRQWSVRRHLPDAHVQHWLALAGEDRAALLELAEALRLRTGQFVMAHELLDEIAVRERAALATILVRPQIRRILEATGSAPGRARELLDVLRAMRFPRLQRASDQLAAKIAELGLPTGIKVILPRALASDEVRIEISAHGAAELERLVDSLVAAREGLARVADLIGGAASVDDEV